MSAFAKETLTSEHGTDGLWHARYPSATATLCGRRSSGFRPGRKRPPTCDVCATTAQHFDEIDGTMPEHWRVGTIEGLKAEREGLKAERARLVDRVRELERSRDLWKQRALDKAAA